MNLSPLPKARTLVHIGRFLVWPPPTNTVSENSNFGQLSFWLKKMRRENLEIHLERSTQWISTHVLFWIFFPSILWEMTTCNLHQWIMNVALLLLEAEKKNYKLTLKLRSFQTAVGSFLPIKTSRGRMVWLPCRPKTPFQQVAPYGELGRRFAVAKPKEVQRVRSRRCYWMVGSSTQGESGGRGKVTKKWEGGYPPWN